MHSYRPGHLVTGRYSLYDISSENARSVGGLNDSSRGTSLENRDQSVAFASVVTTPSGVVNEIRGQFWRSQLDAPGNDLVGPAVSISGVANFGASTSSPVVRDLDVYQINDTLTIQRGAHLLKGGVDLLYNKLFIGFPGALARHVHVSRRSQISDRASTRSSSRHSARRDRRRTTPTSRCSCRTSGGRPTV